MVIGCTIVSACYELAALERADLAALSVVNPNLLAVSAELFVDLQRAVSTGSARQVCRKHRRTRIQPQAGDVGRSSPAASMATKTAVGGR